MSHVTYERLLSRPRTVTNRVGVAKVARLFTLIKSHVALTNSVVTYEWVTSHMNDSCHIFELSWTALVSQVARLFTLIKSHVTLINSVVAYELVTSHINAHTCHTWMDMSHSRTVTNCRIWIWCGCFSTAVPVSMRLIMRDALLCMYVCFMNRDHITNRVYESRTVYTSHAYITNQFVTQRHITNLVLCMYVCITNRDLCITNKFVTHKHITKRVYESRTVYTSHELCTRVTNCACFNDIDAKGRTHLHVRIIHCEPWLWVTNCVHMTMGHELCTHDYESRTVYTSHKLCIIHREPRLWVTNCVFMTMSHELCIRVTNCACIDAIDISGTHSSACTYTLRTASRTRFSSRKKKMYVYIMDRAYESQSVSSFIAAEDWIDWCMCRALLWVYGALMKIFCGYIGLYWGYRRLFCGDMRLFCGNIGLFCGNIGPSCDGIGLFWESFAEI